MERRSNGARIACLAASLCTLPWSALALSAEPSEQSSSERAEVWAPALAAWGARVAAPASGAAPDAPAVGSPTARGLVAPVLGAAGQQTTAALADPTATASVRTPEFERIDETQRWVPSFALRSGLLGQNADADISSDSTVTYTYRFQRASGSGVPITGNQFLTVTRSLAESKTNAVAYTQATPAAPRFPVFLPNVADWIFNPDITPAFPRTVDKILVQRTASPVLPTKGSTLFLTPFQGASLELMTPGLQEAPGRPRLFVHAGAATAFSPTRNVAKEGIPDDLTFPPDAPTVDEAEVRGIGSRTSGSVKTLELQAGIGTAFTVDAFERRFRIKPAVEWIREQIDVSGRLTRALRKDTGAPPGAQPTQSYFLEPIDLQADETRAFYGIGPGLEVEMDAGRAGPVVLSLFLSGQVYYMLGDREVRLTDSQQLTDPELVPANQPQTVSATWDFNLHRWAYQGGLGIRFRWVPED